MGSSGRGREANLLMTETAAYRLCVAVVAALLGALVTAAGAAALVERSGYWPDPAPDCSISPCAGGAVPTPSSIESAVATGPAKCSTQRRVRLRLLGPRGQRLRAVTIYVNGRLVRTRRAAPGRM